MCSSECSSKTGDLDEQIGGNSQKLPNCSSKTGKIDEQFDEQQPAHRNNQPISSLSFSAIALEALPLWLIEFFCSLVIWAVVMPNSGT